MKYFSLFSGIGGFELGIQRATEQVSSTPKRQEEIRDSRIFNNETRSNLRYNRQPPTTCVGFSEIDKYAIQIYKKHFPTHKEYGDVTNIKWSDVPDFELLCGGFPCQSFSIAGKRAGFSDTRGTLFFEIARVTQEKHPRLLFLENVKGLLSHDKGRTFGTILNTLDELGYDLQWQVLNSKNFGVPQNRERIFIIGHLRTTSRPEVFPLPRAYSENVRQGSEKQKSRSWVSTLDSRYGERWSTETYVRQTRIRRLTPTECERLQGFPDGWTEGISDTQRYKCLGNAVTVNVILAITKKLLTPCGGYGKILKCQYNIS
jgi:DNA (cytosine-5)-methyltransferase 1